MNEHPWWSPQTANWLIVCAMFVLLALIALAGWALYLRARAFEAESKRMAEADARAVREAR